MPSSHAEIGSQTMPVASFVSMPLSPEDQGRADLYALCARLLIAAPDQELLASLATADMLDAQEPAQPLELAWEKLVLAASILEQDMVQEEFNALFISVGTPPINPYASLYLAGFLNEKPLVALRADLAQLGLARIAGVREMEDHLAALCEAMRVMICGATGSGGIGSIQRHSLSRQKLFFEKHIASWSSRCFDDIRAADDANFYRLLADFVQAFFSVEAQAFEMDLADADG